jgi:hypothetical protein
MQTRADLAVPTSSESASRRSLTARLGAAAMAAWGAVTGVLPHVLHHVGPLAGAAVVAGATGKVVFGLLGLVAAIPFLRRLYRRFHTWIAPAVALGVFVAAFAVSTFVIGPAISGGSSDSPAKPGIQQPSGHSSHHSP